MVDLLSIISNVLSWAIDCLPTVNIPLWSFPQAVMDIINIAWYFLPMDTVVTLFNLGVGITVFRLVLSIVVRIRDTIFSL